MRFISVCSGIEAASVAWQPLGWKAVAFSEIDPFPCAVLAHHYPDTPNWGDMTKFQEWPDADVDLLCGGTPCQSFSVAGLRKGLDDPRGNLMLTFGAIAARYRPRWLVWENVPGVLSSNGGRDFGSFLGLLGVLGYGFAYRVLDAQFAGVPQRRRRVFVVGCLGDWASAAAVLLERHSLSGNPPPRRQAGPSVAAIAANGVGTCGADDNQGQAGHLIPSTGETAHCLNAGGMGRQDYETETLIAHSLRAEGFDASEDGTGRGTPLVPAIAFGWQNSQSQSDSASEHITPTLDKSKTPAICFSAKDYGADATEDCSQTLHAGGHSASHANAGVMPAVAFQSSQSGMREVDAHATLDANGGSRRHNGVVQAMQVRRLTPRECERLMGFPDDYTRIPWSGWRQMDATETPESCRAEGMEVRQSKKTGKWRVKDVDGPRYKALGNSWAVPCARWIGQRIEAVEEIDAIRRAA